MRKYQDQAVQEYLEKLGPVFVTVMEYRLTHRYMHLMLTTDGMRKCADIYLVMTATYAGELMGGPFKLALATSRDDHDHQFEDQAEQRALCNLEASLERLLAEPFRDDYAELVSAARNRLRDPTD